MAHERQNNPGVGNVRRARAASDSDDENDNKNSATVKVAVRGLFSLLCNNLVSICFFVVVPFLQYYFC